MKYDSFKSTYIIRMVFVVSFVVFCKYSVLNGQSRFMLVGKTDQTENKDVNPYKTRCFSMMTKKLLTKKSKIICWILGIRCRVLGAGYQIYFFW